MFTHVNINTVFHSLRFEKGSSLGQNPKCVYSDVGRGEVWPHRRWFRLLPPAVGWVSCSQPDGRQARRAGTVASCGATAVRSSRVSGCASRRSMAGLLQLSELLHLSLRFDADFFFFSKFRVLSVGDDGRHMSGSGRGGRYMRGG